MTPLIVKGRAEALDDLCSHWFLGHYLTERTLNQAVFLMDALAIETYAPYFFLAYGKSIEVIAPKSCKQKLVSIATDLMKYYQTQQLP